MCNSTPLHPSFSLDFWGSPWHKRHKTGDKSWCTIHNTYSYTLQWAHRVLGHLIFFFLEEKRASNEENNNPHTRMWKERKGGGYCIFLYSRWYKPNTGSVAEAIVVNFLLSFVCVCVSFCVKVKSGCSCALALLLLLYIVSLCNVFSSFLWWRTRKREGEVAIIVNLKFLFCFRWNRINTSSRLHVSLPQLSIPPKIIFYNIPRRKIERLDRYCGKTGEKFFINMRKMCVPPPTNCAQHHRQKRPKMYTSVDKTRWTFFLSLFLGKRGS
jgi:hypothetical protein